MPFFELCIATIAYIENQIMSVQVTGVSSNTWWYKITPNGTTLSLDQGVTWSPVDAGWTLPTTQWTSNPRYFATGPLNWMAAQQVDWWTQPAPSTDPKAIPATWFWFISDTGEGPQYPFRLMFGAAPASPTMGDPNQLAFFQNFSFTYFPFFAEVDFPPVDSWQGTAISGFSFGTGGLDLFVWNSNFGMTTISTPVDSTSSPLPGWVLYHWTPDSEYQVLTDRAQITNLSYVYNAVAYDTQTVLMFGAAPSSVPDPSPFAGNALGYNTFPDGSIQCGPITAEGMPLGAEPPSWASSPGEGGRIWAVVADNEALCPNQTVALISEIFPPTTAYPNGRYLWTWYSPFPGSGGLNARPVTFMESASSVAEGGTSLALADYYDYQEFNTPIPPSFYDIPSVCPVPGTTSDAAKQPKPAPAPAPTPAPAEESGLLAWLLALLRRLLGRR